jgi:hypothetical protein
MCRLIQKKRSNLLGQPRRTFKTASFISIFVPLPPKRNKRETVKKRFTVSQKSKQQKRNEIKHQAKTKIKVILHKVVLNRFLMYYN